MDASSGTYPFRRSTSGQPRNPQRSQRSQPMVVARAMMTMSAASAPPAGRNGRPWFVPCLHTRAEGARTVPLRLVRRRHTLALPAEYRTGTRRSVLRERSWAMRNHGALRLVAVAAFAVTLVAAPAVAQQASGDQRTRTENRPSAPAVRTSVPNRSPAVRQPARTPERSPAIRTPASTQPTIRREIPRTQPADGGTRAPSKRPAIEHGTTRRPHYLDREPSIHQRFPRTPTTGGAHPAPDAQRITFDRDAITLRLDDYSPAERARILEGLMQLVR